MKKLRVYKYSLNITGDMEYIHPIHENTRFVSILSVGLDPQTAGLCLWALVDIECQLEGSRTICYQVVGTGAEDPIVVKNPKRNFLGTAICGSLVFHVFGHLKS
jgi:hypothetical protein